MENQDLKNHRYTDDTQVYTYPSILGDSDKALNRLSTCIMNSRRWMSSTNKLKLNDDRIELVISASPQVINSLTDPTLHVGETI